MGMSNIFLHDEEPQHFLMDSKGDLYQVSEELAKEHSVSRGTVTVSRIDKETNTIYFCSPLPDEVKAEK